MKDKLLQALKLKFIGVSDATLERIAAKKSIGITEETQIDAVVGNLTFPDIVQSEVDFKITEANRKAVENYETKHGIKDGKPREDKKPDNVEIPADLPESFKVLLANQQKMIEGLTATVQNFVTGQTKQTNAQKVQAELVKSGVPVTFLKGRSLEVEKDEDIETKVLEIKGYFDEDLQQRINDGVVVVKPVNPDPNNNGEPKTVTVGSYLDEKFGKES